MRSVYAKILLFSFATLTLSLVAFVGASILVSMQNANRAGFFGQVSLELDEAREAYEEGGPAKLAAFEDRLDRRLSGKHHLTDTRGRDLLTGTDRSALLAEAQPEGSPARHLRRPQVLVAASEDGRYRWIIEFGPPQVDLKGFLPYYILIFGAVALVCWLLAVSIASPLRGLARTVDRFGAGDLAVRVNSTRKDEIGELGRAFDRMAERIGTLLTAERRLLQDISHELRSPLARLSFAAELVRTAGDRDVAVARLKKEIQRLTDLVGALLEVTMAEGDPSAAATERFRLDDLLMEVVEDCLWKPTAADAPSHCGPEPPWPSWATARFCGAPSRTWSGTRFVMRPANRRWKWISRRPRARPVSRCAITVPEFRMRRCRKSSSPSSAWTIRAIARLAEWVLAWRSPCVP